MRRLPLRSVTILALAGLCCAASVSLDSMKRVEASINDKFKSDINDPYDLMGTARGSYLPGYGVVFTVEMNVITVPQLMVSPFNPPPTAAALLQLHDRKIRKLAVLRETMRGLIAGASQSMPALLPEDNIMMEAFLFNWSWENVAGVPHRIVLAANKQKLLDALNRHAAPAEMAALFEDKEL
ncbi:MAG: hypothetical protein M3N54_06550 [Acidobacteriota bacterium]|nr:hypothetical protein [Acidobacteriota bacterium]